MRCTSLLTSVQLADLAPRISPGAAAAIFITLKLQTNGSGFALNADVAGFL